MQLWVIKFDNFGIQENPDPIQAFSFQAVPGPLTGGEYYESPDNAGIENQNAIGISSPGIPAATSARIRVNTIDPGPAFTKYFTSTVTAYYALDTWFITALNRSQLKGGITLPWNWAYGATDDIIDVTLLLDAMQADPVYVPGLDFHMVFMPDDYLPQPISSGHPWGHAPDPFGGPTHFETLP